MAVHTSSIPPQVRHLTASNGREFEKYLARWSNVAKKTPAAILLPTSEDECREAVQWAIANNIPFTCKSGGMSLYSTIDDQGVVIDLSEYSGVEHDASNKTAVLIGSIQVKTVAVELAKDGCYTPLPSANTIGAIPFFLNGGNSPLTSRVGFGSDCIISARVITADGNVIDVNADQNSDLLYAIRGAGQYFGLVTRLTVRTFSFEEAVGNSRGTVWSGPFVFPQARAEEVCEAVNKVISNTEFPTGGLIYIGAPPPQRKPAIAVIVRLVGENASELQKEAFKPLYDLGPIFTAGGDIPVANIADSQNPVCAPGDFKKLTLAGLRVLEPKAIAEVTGVWQEMIAKYPEATGTWFSAIWDSQMPPRPAFESANSMHDVRFWANNLTWTNKGENSDALQLYSEKVFEIYRKQQSVDGYVDFTNSSREGPIERRYRGVERLEKLRKLKRSWDGQGRFSTQFL